MLSDSGVSSIVKTTFVVTFKSVSKIEDVVLLAVKEYITEMAVQVLIENFTYIHNKKSLKIPKG